MAIGSGIGLLFRIKGDNSEAKTALKDLDKYFDDSTLRWRGASGRFVAGITSDFSNVGGIISGLGNQIGQLGGIMTSVGAGFVAGLTAPILGLGIAATKTFADIELAVANISTIKPEIDTSGVMSALNEMSTRIPQTAQQLGDGLYDIFSSINVSQKEGLALLEQFAKGATAAQTDAKTFGTAVLGVMNAYKLSTADASHITDVFFNTVNLGVVSGAELASSLGVVTQSAKGASVELDELGALIVGVTKEGGPAAQNINNLANFLNKIALPDSAKDIKKFFDVDIVDKATGQFKSMVEVLAEIKPKYDALSESAQKKALASIFPDAQAQQGARVLLSQLDAVKEALKTNQETAGAASKAYEKIAATVSVQFSLLKNSVIAILSEIGSALLPLLQPVLSFIAESVVPAISYLVELFKSLSPVLQTVIVAVAGFAAAIGPVLIVVGAILSFLAPLISGIGGLVTSIVAAGSITAFLAGALTTLGTIITIVIIPALKIIIPVAVAVGVVFAALAAAAAALYLAWKTDFGGVQSFTLQFFETIKSTVKTVFDFIYGIVQSVGGAIVGWWRENYPLIEGVVKQVSDSIKTTISTFLNLIQGLWAEYGETILAHIRTVLGIIKDFFSTVFDQIGSFIRAALQLWNGQFSDAWQTILGAAERFGEYFVRFWRQLWDVTVATLKQMGDYLKNNFLSIMAKSGQIIVEGVGYILKVVARLPFTLLELVPVFAKAGWELSKAIVRGMAIGFKDNPVPTPTIQGGSGGSFYFYIGGNGELVTADDFTVPDKKNGGLGITDSKEADKRRKEREAAFKTELAARDEQLRIQLQTERDRFAEAQKNLEDQLANRIITVRQYQEQALSNIKEYEVAISDIIAKQGESAQRGKSGTDLENENQKSQQAAVALAREIAQERADVEKLVTENQRKEREKQQQTTLERLRWEADQTQRSYQAKQAWLDSQYAQGLIKEETYQKTKQKLTLDWTSATEENQRLKGIETQESWLNYKRANLEAQAKAVEDNWQKEKAIYDERLAAAVGDADRTNAILQAKKQAEEAYLQEKAQIAKEINRTLSEVEIEYFRQQKENAEASKKSLQEQAELAKELLEIKTQLAQVERNLLDFRAEQTRKSLKNLAENATGKERIKLLQDLWDLEIEEANRKRRDRLADLKDEKAADLERIQGKANEAEQKFQIEQLYKERVLLAEEEFQAKLKEIRDSFDPQIQNAEGENIGGGLFGGLIGGLGVSIDQMLKKVEPLKIIGNIIGAQFQAIAQGVGNAVAAFVKFGTVGGSFRKFAAELIASIASMAAVQAVWELAQGFAMLALAYFGHPKAKESATGHFIAAAVFGGIAGIAAIAGRAIAGDAFKQQTATATGQSQQQSGGNNSNSQVGAYSSFGDETTIVDVARNSPTLFERMKAEITLKLDSNGVLKILKDDVENNGQSRGLILNVVEQN